MQLKRAGNKCVRCAQHTHKLLHLSGAGECHPSFMEATGGSVKMFMGANELTQPQHRNTQREPKKHRPRQTDRHTHTNTNTHTHTLTHTHLGGRSATCWAHLGGSHNERGTVATHTQVPTRRKQMRLHVGSPLVRVKWASPSTSRLQNTLLDAASPCFLACRQCTLHPCF